MSYNNLLMHDGEIFALPAEVQRELDAQLERSLMNASSNTSPDAKAIEAWFDQEFADLMEPTPAEPGAELAGEEMALLEALDEPPAMTIEESCVIEITRLRSSPHTRRYDKLFARRVYLEAQTQTDATQRELAIIEREIKLELERSTDDKFRARRNIDEWREGVGQDEYNASRRKVRTAPNAPRQCSASEEERKERRRLLDRERKAKAKAAMTEEGLAAIREATRLSVQRHRAAKKSQTI